MAIPNSPEPTEAAAADASTDVLDPQADVALEPLTPESALEWNRYYDRYVAGGVLLLVLLVSIHKITPLSSVWPTIKFGEVMVRTGAPVTTDVFSYTEAGKPWVNVPWVYQLASYLTFSNLGAMFTADPALKEQIGAGALIFLSALARTFTVFLLLRYRRPGPGLWWFSVVALVAMGAMIAPRSESLELSVGGIARQAIVSPETWGNLLLALEVLLLDRGLVLGRKKALLYALPPLFLVWANLDDSFAFGLIVLAVATVASALHSRKPTPSKGAPDRAALAPPIGLIGGIAAGCLAICIVNPSTFRIYSAAFAPYFAIPKMVFSSGTYLSLPDHLAFVGSDSWDFIRRGSGETAPRLRLAYFLVVVVSGLATFALDRRKLSVYRLALYLVAALAWCGLNRLSAEFAIVFAYVVGLNGQEWYQDRYGLQGRISGGWTFWSIGGRSATILVTFLLMAKTLTGYGYPVGRATFGFGYDRSEFDFEAADYLKDSKITGQVMNLSDVQGDALIYRAYPTRKTFVDRRRGVFGTEARRDLAAFRSAFTSEAKEVPMEEGKAPEDAGSVNVTLKEDPDQWRPVMDKYKASAVLLVPEQDFRVYATMLTSKNWVLLHDDGHTVIFGRADASEADKALFAKEKLDAVDIVYHRKQRLEVPDRSPTPMTVIDSIIRNRTLAKPQPHIAAGEHWLSAGATVENNGRPDAAHAIMAIREARKALHFNPDETDAYRLLDLAYEKLTRNEFAAFQAKKQSVPAGYFNFRARQRITALTYAIQTTPPGRDADSKAVLAESYERLALLYRSTGDLDMERDCLAEIRELVPPGDFPAEESKRLDQIDDQIAKFKDQLQKATADSGSDNPMQRAGMAMNAGFTGMAIRDLEEAENQGVPLDQLLNSLVSLYCRTGQPEKANEKLMNRPLDDPALYSGPGTPAYTHGLVNMLLGYYDNAVAFWRDNSLAQALMSEKNQGLAVARELLGGLPERAVNTTMDLTGLPGKPGLIETEASWEFELGLCLLESGDPDAAGKHFLKCLEYNPKIAVRALVEDYLKKLGVPIPPVPSGDGEPARPAPAEAAKPAEPAAEKPPAEAPKVEAPAEAKKP